jgi:hypothetical protein
MKPFVKPFQITQIESLTATISQSSDPSKELELKAIADELRCLCERVERTLKLNESVREPEPQRKFRI